MVMLDIEYNQRHADYVGSNLFNLVMEKAYYPTSLIKFQVEETDILYLLQNKMNIGKNSYTIRTYIEKPRNYYHRCYCYCSSHPSTRFRKLNTETTSENQYHKFKNLAQAQETTK